MLSEWFFSMVNVKASLSPKYFSRSALCFSTMTLNSLHHNFYPESKLQISFTTITITYKCHTEGGRWLHKWLSPCYLQMLSPGLALFPSLLSSGESGEDGCMTLNPGRSLLQEVVHQRLSAFQAVTSCPPTIQTPLWYPHHLSRPPPHRDHLSLRSDDAPRFIWILFLPFSLPLPSAILVQECFHLGPLSPC